LNILVLDGEEMPGSNILSGVDPQDILCRIVLGHREAESADKEWRARGGA